MKKAFIIIILIASVGFGQNYKITDFKPDSLKIWQVYAEGKLNSDVSQNETAYSEDYSDIFNFRFDPEINFEFSKIRKRSILEYNLSGSLAKYISKYDTKIREQDGSRQNLNLKINHYYRKYYIGKLGLFNQSHLYVYKYFNDNIDDKETEDVSTSYKKYTNNQFIYDIKIEPGVVFGRIYDGQYSAKAMEIIDEIRKAGLLKKELSKKQYIKLSQIILERKEVLHYDSRIKKMEALKEIITYLKKIGAINTDQILALLIIEDIYSYDYSYNTIPRQSGFEIYANLELNNRNSDTDRENKLFQEIFNGELSKYEKVSDEFDDYKIVDTKMLKGINLGINHNKIYNWNLSHDINFNIRYQDQIDDLDIDSKYVSHYYLPFDTTETGKEKSNQKDSRYYLQTSFDANFYYQINSRSYLSLNNTIGYSLQNTRREKDDVLTRRDTYENFHFVISPEYTYYLTPKFFLSGGYIYYWIKDWDKILSGTKFGYTYQMHSISLELGYYL